jgi:hypothetical protein
MSTSAAGPVLSVAFIANQLGPPAELKTISSKNANWTAVEPNIS